VIGRALLAALLLAAAGGAGAQAAVYRCGNEYSRMPCSQGMVVDTQGSARTEAQRAEAVRVVASEKQLAGDTAHDRRRAEAANRRPQAADGEDFVAQLPAAKA